MTLETIAVVAPGDMGHASGALMRRNGARVVTCLEGRSARSAGLAQKAGIEALPDFATLVREADILLSIVPPANAEGLAETVAAAVSETGASLYFADCNAISPQRALAVAGILEPTAATYIDASIIGMPPSESAPSPRFYASGPEAGVMRDLIRFGVDVRVMGQGLTEASALKMCYASFTKGQIAIATQSFTAAEALGVKDALLAEMAGSLTNVLESARRMVPMMPPRAYRWVDEMEQIGETFAGVGMSERMFGGVADLYRFVESTPLGREIPEARTRGTTLEDVAADLGAALTEKKKTAAE